MLPFSCMKNLFEFSSYKSYLRALIEDSELRGYVSKLAKAAECQRSYLSKVLQRDSNIHLTPDHIFGICEYLQLTEVESDYLKLLLEKERASQLRYRQAIEKRLLNFRNQYLNLKKQLGKDQIETDERSSGFYYNYWLYSALHIAVSIPELQNLSALSRRFALPTDILVRHLQELEKLGLVQSKNSKWIWQSGDIHLPKDSLAILPHHMNWRNQAIQNLSLRHVDATHYSVVQSLSQADYETLRMHMLDWIKKFQAIASPSAPEELICFNLDLFRVGSI